MGRPAFQSPILLSRLSPADRVVASRQPASTPCVQVPNPSGTTSGVWSSQKTIKLDTRMSAEPDFSAHRGDTPAIERTTNGDLQQQQRELITPYFVSTRPVDAAAAIAHAAPLLLHLRLGLRKSVLLPFFRRHTLNCHAAHTEQQPPQLISSVPPPIYTNHQQPVSM